MSVDDVMGVVDENGFDVTFTGGDPLLQSADILPLARRLRDNGYTIWCYTGYLYEDVCHDSRFSGLLDCCEVLVDGRFDESLRDIHLLFRGSSNQRLIDLSRSTAAGEAVIWTPEEIDI